MEQKYDLNPSRKKGAKDLRRTGKTASKRWTAILLSVILAAGNCVPAMAAEASGTQGMDSGITAEEYEQDAAAASEEQDAGEETEQMPSEEAPENDEEPDADEKKDADEGSDASSNHEAGEENTDGFATDESEIAAAETEVSESDEEDGLTDEAEDENADADRSEDITELEEPVETEGVSKEALAQADASLSDYDYSFSSVGGTEVVKLDYYNGSETNISVPGTVTVDGDSYYVSADSAYVWDSVDLESITFGSGFIFPEYSDQFFTACADTLESVDMSNADLSGVLSVYEMFNNCSSLTYVGFGNADGHSISNTLRMFYNCSAIEEIDLHFLAGAYIDTADSMFAGCSSLRTVDLSGVHMEDAVNQGNVYNFFSGCTSLEEIVTPIVEYGYYAVGISLPGCFADESGNLLTKISSDFTSSRTLQAVEIPAWLMDYDFSIDTDDGTIELHSYKGEDSDLFVPGSAVVEEQEYRITLMEDGYIWGSGVTRLTFGDVKFPESMSYTFGANLQYLDLSAADFSEVGFGYYMLDDCVRLQTIITPVGLSSNVPLPKAFVDGNGDQYTELPKDLTESIELQAASVSEWLEDYYYKLSGDAIILKKYVGDADEIMVPASAVVGNKTYNKIQITPGIWRSSSVVSLSFEGPVDFDGYAYRMFDNMEQLEHLDLNNQTGMIKDASYMFTSCPSLQSLDLSGFDFSECRSSNGMFDGCNALQTIKTPVNVRPDSKISLPSLYNDAEGNLYSFLPEGLVSSITLTRVTDMSEWLSDYHFELEGDRIALTGYAGNSETVTVPGSAVIGTKEIHKIEPRKGTWNSHFWWYSEGRSQLSFEEGVILPKDSSRLFEDLCVSDIDLSKVDVSETTDMSDMFTGCRKLNTIITPKNITLDANLPGPFEDTGGNIYFQLPKNLSESIILTRSTVDQSEWLNDYEYYISGDKIILTRYLGYNGEVTVPGSATVNGTSYGKIQIGRKIDWTDRGVQTLSFSEGVIFPDDCSNLFVGNWSLKTIDLSNVDTSNVTNMAFMFYDCNIRELDISGVDTSKVTDMSGMFLRCNDLQALDVSGFDTSNVKKMRTMFADCGNLKTLDVSGFDTSKVTDMFAMFDQCHSLQTLDVSGFDTSKVADINYIFSDCNSLHHLDIGNWDLSSVSSGDRMFGYVDDFEMIKAPAGVPVKIILPAIYTGSDGRIYKSLPMNMDESIVLTRTSDYYDSAYGGSEDTEQTPIAITEQPGDVRTRSGKTVRFKVTAPGSGLSYQWQWSTDGMTWKNCSSGTYNTDTFSFTMKDSYDGRQYRCKITDGSHIAYTRSASLTLGNAEIVSQPADVEAGAGETVTFTVGVQGEAPAYQWQWSANGTTWKNCSSAGYNTDTFSFKMKETLSCRQYRCRVTCGEETLISDAATITLVVRPEIISQPADVEAGAGETVTFTIGVQGEAPAYQWQWSANGTTWKNCTSGGYNTDTFSFKMKETLSGRQYRCRVTCGGETLISDAATITLVVRPAIISQPADVEAGVGETVTITIGVQGEDPAYQWQWSSNGTTWKNCTSAGYNTDTFSFEMKETLSGRRYRCKVTCGGETLISDAATITFVVRPAIISQPVNVQAAVGETVTFTVGVQGEDPVYQWQWSADGTTWKNCTSAGYNTDTFGFTMKAWVSGRQYRCRVTFGEETLISEAGMISLK